MTQILKKLISEETLQQKRYMDSYGMKNIFQEIKDIFHSIT
jgi:hypothetical protein